MTLPISNLSNGYQGCSDLPQVPREKRKYDYLDNRSSSTRKPAEVGIKVLASLASNSPASDRRALPDPDSDPDLEVSWSQSRAIALRCPPAPRRCPVTPRKPVRVREAPFIANARTYQTTPFLDTFYCLDQSIRKLERLGGGDFNEIYRCRSDGPLGSQYVLKFPGIERLRMSCVRSVVVQYAQCRAVGISVADHANLNPHIESSDFQRLLCAKDQSALLAYVKDTVKDGFYLVRYIHEPIAFWSAETAFVVPTDPTDPWVQIKEIFRLAYQNAIPLDLKRSNVGIYRNPEDRNDPDNGKVFLFDMRDGEEDDDFNVDDNGKANPFRPFIDNGLNSFTDNSALRAYLDPR